MKPMRMHHVGIVLPEKSYAQDLIDMFGLEVDYTGFVNAYSADLIFTKYGEKESPI